MSVLWAVEEIVMDCFVYIRTDGAVQCHAFPDMVEVVVEGEVVGSELGVDAGLAFW